MIGIIVALICAAICGVLASYKGRNVVGWVVCGFLLGLIGLIILLCLSNLKQERQYRQTAETRNRRLSEQLRQEQLKSEAMRRHVAARLDAHDGALQMDTRQTTALPMSDAPLEQLSNAVRGTSALPNNDANNDVIDSLMGMSINNTQPQPAAVPVNPSQPQTLWYYESNGQSHGPIRTDDIHRMLHAGTLQATTLLWSEILTDWTPAHLIPEFVRTDRA